MTCYMQGFFLAAQMSEESNNTLTFYSLFLDSVSVYVNTQCIGTVVCTYRLSIRASVVAVLFYTLTITKTTTLAVFTCW